MIALMTVPEAASALCTSSRSVYRLIEDGSLPVVNVGRKGGRVRIRISEDAVAAFVASRTTPARKGR